MERDALIAFLQEHIKQGEDVGILDNQAVFTDLKIETVQATKCNRFGCRYPAKRAKTNLSVLMAASKVVVY